MNVRHEIRHVLITLTKSITVFITSTLFFLFLHLCHYADAGEAFFQFDQIVVAYRDP